MQIGFNVCKMPAESQKFHTLNNPSFQKFSNISSIIFRKLPGTFACFDFGGSVWGSHLVVLRTGNKPGSATGKAGVPTMLRSVQPHIQGFLPQASKCLSLSLTEGPSLSCQISEWFLFCDHSCQIIHTQKSLSNRFSSGKDGLGFLQFFTSESRNQT